MNEGSVQIFSGQIIKYFLYKIFIVILNSVFLSPNLMHLRLNHTMNGLFGKYNKINDFPQYNVLIKSESFPDIKQNLLINYKLK